MTIGASWYATNSARVYPLRADVTAVDDSGQRFPESIIADIKVRYPASDDAVLRVASVHVGKRIDIIFMAGDTLVAAFSGDRQNVH